MKRIIYMKIVKVINNNTVCVVDDNGLEQIVLGKGIGFSKKAGDTVSREQIQKVYIIGDTGLRKRMINCLAEIPYEYIKLTDSLVEYIKSHIKDKLNESLIVTLSDHIGFAIERKKQGMEILNPLMNSIRNSFPEELSLGYYCVDRIKEEIGVELHPDEAGFIAMHIVSARLSTDLSKVHGLTSIINGCMNIIDTVYCGKIDKNTLAYEQLSTFIKELAQRVLNNQTIPVVLARDEDYKMTVEKEFPIAHKCAKCIQDFILKNYKKSVSCDDVLLLTLFIRIAAG